MPLLTHYALSRHKPRKSKRLYDQRARTMKALVKEYFRHNKVKMVDGSKRNLQSPRQRLRRELLHNISLLGSDVVYLEPPLA